MISDDDFHNQLQAWLIPMAQLDPEPRRNGFLGVPGSLEVEAKFSDRWIGLRENLHRKFLVFFTRKYGEIWWFPVNCPLNQSNDKKIIPSQSKQPTI